MPPNVAEILILQRNVATRFRLDWVFGNITLLQLFWRAWPGERMSKVGSVFDKNYVKSSAVKK